MNFVTTIIETIFHRQEHVETVDARVENAVFDLKRATQANIATTKLLDDLLHRDAP